MESEEIEFFIQHDNKQTKPVVSTEESTTIPRPAKEEPIAQNLTKEAPSTQREEVNQDNAQARKIPAEPNLSVDNPKAPETPQITEKPQVQNTDNNLAANNQESTEKQEIKSEEPVPQPSDQDILEVIQSKLSKYPLPDDKISEMTPLTPQTE